MSNYPIFRFPSSINSANSAVPLVPVSLGIPPKEPPKEPGDKPKRIEWEAILGRELMSSLRSKENLPLSKLIPIVCSVPLVTIFRLLPIYRQIKDYPQRVQRWERQRKDFEYLQSEYKQKKAQYEQRQNVFFTQKQIEEYRKQQLGKALSKTLPHDGVDSQARKGRSEKMFAQHLNQHFPGKIYTDLTLKRPSFDHPYSPDFTYIDKVLNLYIDIEIDEPYIFHTGDPTHFQECQKDKRRNDFFLNKNWIIIRFAEEQVCKYPEECCKYVATVASTCGIPIPTSLKNVATPPSVSHWTKAEAEEMAVKKTRDSYKCNFR